MNDGSLSDVFNRLNISFLSMVLGGFRYTYCDDILDISQTLVIFSYCSIMRLTFVVLLKYIYNNNWTD